MAKQPKPEPQAVIRCTDCNNEAMAAVIMQSGVIGIFCGSCEKMKMRIGDSEEVKKQAIKIFSN